nr:MAG TPA: hypothetical protein [Caudoviricetes sp.]
MMSVAAVHLLLIRRHGSAPLLRRAVEDIV